MFWLGGKPQVGDQLVYTYTTAFHGLLVGQTASERRVGRRFVALPIDFRGHRIV